MLTDVMMPGSMNRRQLAIESIQPPAFAQAPSFGLLVSEQQMQGEAQPRVAGI
jgi:hypothetical protein